MRASSTWSGMGARIQRHLADSWWRLFLGTLVVIVLPVVVLFAVRGMRGAWLWLLGLPAAVAAAWSFAHPYPALLLSLFIGLSGLDIYLPGPVSHALLALVLSRVIFDVLGGRKLDWGVTSFRVSLLVLVGLCLTSLLRARQLSLAFEELLLIAMGFATYVAISALATTPRRVYTIALLLAASFALATLFTLKDLLASGGFGLLAYLTEVRTRIADWDPNVAAVQADCLLPMAVFAALQERGWRRLGVTVVIVLLVLAVVLTASRAGLGLLAFALGVILLRQPRARVVALMALLVLAAVTSMLPHEYWVRFVSFGQFQSILIDRSLQLRQHALEGGWDLFLQHPWLGVGLGNFQAESVHFMSTQMMAHNAYLEIAVNLGVFGFLAYVAWMWSGLEMVGRARRLWRIEGRAFEAGLADTLGVAIVVFALGALVLSIPFYLVLWLLLALANALRASAEHGQA